MRYLILHSADIAQLALGIPLQKKEIQGKKLTLLRAKHMVQNRPYYQKSYNIVFLNLLFMKNVLVHLKGS